MSSIIDNLKAGLNDTDQNGEDLDTKLNQPIQISVKLSEGFPDAVNLVKLKLGTLKI